MLHQILGANGHAMSEATTSAKFCCQYHVWVLLKPKVTSLAEVKACDNKLLAYKCATGSTHLTAGAPIGDWTLACVTGLQMPPVLEQASINCMIGQASMTQCDSDGRQAIPTSDIHAAWQLRRHESAATFLGFLSCHIFYPTGSPAHCM